MVFGRIQFETVLVIGKNKREAYPDTALYFVQVVRAQPARVLQPRPPLGHRDVGHHGHSHCLVA